jgi:glycosyltransferase involved in cell wall biosynthesis
MSRSPRVVHVVPALFGPSGIIGGGERYALELSRTMAERVPTTLISFGARPRRERFGALEVRVLTNWIHFRRFQLDPFNPLLLAHLARADIIHYHQTHTMMAGLALLFAKVTHKPIFTTHLGSGGFGIHNYVDISRWYTGHLHISRFSLEVFGHRDLATARVILGGVDTTKFAPDSDPATPRDGGVLCVARLLPHKGINDLIDAVDTDTPLTIIGRRWRHAARYYDLLRQRAAGKRVTFREDCDDDDLVRAYRRAWCVVLPSVYTTVFGERYTIPELLGQALLEGMACGAPAICTAVGGMPEVVVDGVTGFVVPPNDPAALGEKIRWLRDHSDEAQRMGQAARRRVLDHFTWDRVVDHCLAAYGLADPGRATEPTAVPVAATPRREGGNAP